MQDVQKPMEGLHEIGTPPFLTKTYEMVDDQATDDVVSWSIARNSFIVWDSSKFSTTLLRKYFKHGNFFSFIRQLNTYGFRKVDPDRWEFANEGFLKGQKDLLKTIKRRRHAGKNVQHGGGSACVEVGEYGLEGVLERLKRDCNVLMTEMVRQKQQEKESREYMIVLQKRLIAAERKQKQMMGFLAKAVNNPVFIQQILLETAERKALDEDNVKRKRRLIASTSRSTAGGEEFLEKIDDLAVYNDSVGQGQLQDEQGQDELADMRSEFDSLFSTNMESGSSTGVKQQMAEPMAMIGESNIDSVNEMLLDELLGDHAAVDNDDDDVDRLLLGHIPEVVDLGGESSSDWDEDLQDLVDQINSFEPKP